MPENTTQQDNKKTTVPVNNGINFFAVTNFRSQRIKFGIKQDDRRRHMYLIGKTGMGKSTVLENMFLQDIMNGEGTALIDPHGDFAEKILDYVPNNRVKDVIYFNPADIGHPIAFNVMESVSPEHKHLVASGLVGVFKKLWADSWGPRLEYVLRNAILALMDYPDSTLLGVMRILVDKNYRRNVISKIKDPMVRSFWVEEYSKYPDRFQAEAIAPIQNKVGQFLSTSLIRNIVGQVKSSIDLRDIMDNQKILIMNLSKGRIGEDASALMGAMMITKIQLAAMSRIDMPEENRQDFYLYVDEFQNFATESFANILSEARKYRLDLILAHQYIEQLDETVRAAVFGNVGTIMSFRIGAADAEYLEQEFAPYFDQEDLVNLTKFDVYMKLMIEGVSSTPFSATTLPPLFGLASTKNTKKIILLTRENYAITQDVVEDEIARWSGMKDAPDNPIEKRPDTRTSSTRFSTSSSQSPRKEKPHSPQHTKKEKNKPIYIVECVECGDDVEVHFKPDGVRPIFCRKCFQKVRGHGTKTVEQKQKPLPKPEVPDTPLSLQEALQKKPVSFQQKKGAQQRTSEQPQDEENLPHDAPDAELVHTPTQTVPTTPEPDHEQQKVLHPGDVVKF